METKRFTVVDTRTNSLKTFNTTATTMGELKRDLIANGINPEGMAMQEGLSHIELDVNNDDLALPTNVPMRNSEGTTNNLVLRLTQREKKIKSGMTRKEAYDAIKTLGLANDIAKKFGKNYTVVKTDDLVAVIEKANKKAAKKVTKDVNVECSCPTAEALTKLINILVNNGTISDFDGVELTEILGTNLDTKVNEYTLSEIDQMFADFEEA